MDKEEEEKVEEDNKLKNEYDNRHNIIIVES